MKLYLKLTLNLMSLLMTQFVIAQEGLISGRLQDQNDQTIPFATVSVMQLPDSTLVTGTTTDMDGTFRISPKEAGNFVLRFSAIGFSPAYTSSFKVSGSGFSRDFGTIQMKEETTMLNEVMVETWRPRIRMEANKMVVRVEGTAMAAGSTAFDVLSRSPGVTANQDGNLLLNGKDGVSVMIDGRLTYLAPAELKTMLQGMSAENIEEIEVINNPSASYDAEGTAGILNIKLKTNNMTGLNGSVYSGYQYNRRHFYNAGANLNYKKGNWNSFLTVDAAERGRVRDQFMSRTFAGENGGTVLEQTGEDYKRRFTPSIRLGTDYDFDPNHSIGIMATFTYQELTNDWNTSGWLHNRETGERIDIEAKNRLEEDFGTGRVNLHYTGQLDSIGTKLSADLDYVRLSEENISTFSNLYYIDNSEEEEELTSITNSGYNIYSARADLSLPLSETTKLELGVKGSQVKSRSELDFFTEKEGIQIPDPSRSDQFTYEEEIYAGYMEFSHRFDRTWTLQAGLRAEQTMAQGMSIAMDQTLERNYLNLFPNVMLEQNVSDDYIVNYAYSRRINRPDYERLNPFIFYLDPYTYVEGNPELRPAFTNSFQLTQTFMNKYTLLLKYEHTKDDIGEVPLQNPETQETVFAIRNLDNFRNYSATIVAPVEISSSWNMNNNLVMARHKYSSIINGQNLENKGFFVMAQSNHQVKLPQNISLEINSTYRGPIAAGFYQIEDQWWVDAGLKRAFLKDKLDVTLNFVDVFRSRTLEGSSNIHGNTTAVDQYMGYQSVNLTLRYKFNQGAKVEAKNRQADLEELNRAGGN